MSAVKMLLLTGKIEKAYTFLHDWRNSRPFSKLGAWCAAKPRAYLTAPQTSARWDLLQVSSRDELYSLVKTKLFCYCLFRTWRPSFQSTQSRQQCNVQVTEEAKWTKSRWSKVLIGEQPPLALQSGQEFCWKMYWGNLCVISRHFWLHRARNETRFVYREEREGCNNERSLTATRETRLVSRETRLEFWETWKVSWGNETPLENESSVERNMTWCALRDTRLASRETWRVSRLARKWYLT